jgi:hypothetical protein
MAHLPKGFRNNININPGKIGPERRQEILDDIADNGTFLPRGVSEEDMDESFLDFVKTDLGITLDGEKVPVLFLTIQRWSEFTKTWQFSDKYKDIQLPFITVVRKPDAQVGQNQAGNYNIPGNRTYTYMKVPTWDGARKGMDVYKVPQPTPVDISYEVRIFTNRMRDLNKLNSLVQRTFQSRQAYINVKGHPMPVHLEGISDESNIDDFENRRFYVQLFDMTLLGYILDENDFEVIPTINRVYTMIEVEDAMPIITAIKEVSVFENTVNFNFIFKPYSDTDFTFTSNYGVSLSNLTNIENITRIIIYRNGAGIFDGTILSSPITFSANDRIRIKVYKQNNLLGKFQLIGNTI